MNTRDFTTKLSSSKLKENLNKMFNVNVSLEKYSREQLEDMRNKLRTRMFQQEGRAGINDLLTNETYQKDKAMLALLNTRIKEMLGEDIKKLKDKMVELSEAKKGVRAPKHKIHAQGTAAKDWDGDGKKESPKDEVWGSRAKAAAKAGKPFSEAAKPDFLDMDKDGDKKEPMKKAAKEKKVKEAEDRPAAKKKETTWTDKSGKKHPATRVQGSKSVAADKEANKERKAMDKDMSEAADRPDSKKTATTWTDKSGKKHPATRVQGSKSVAADKEANKERKAMDKDMSEGKDEGKPGKGFEKIVKKATPKYGKETAMKIAGAQRQKMKKAGKLEEANAAFKHNVRFVNESLAFLIQEDEEGKAKAITAAGDIVNDYTSWMQRVGQYQTKSMIELADAIRADFGAAEAEAFKQAVAPALSQTLEVLTQQREAISNAVAVLAGEATPEAPMGMEPEMPPEPGMEPAGPDAMNPEPADEFGASDAAAGAGITGREMRESKFARKLAESHNIMAKLAK